MNTSENGKIENLGDTTEAVTKQAAPGENAPEQEVERETVTKTESTEHVVEKPSDEG